MFEIIDVWKSFGDKQVLKGVSLSVKNGQIFCLIGPNGSGKTTLLRIANMLEKPDNGKIFFDGVNLLELNDIQKLFYIRKMAMVFQQPVIYNSNVFDNVSIGLRIRGLRKEEIKERVIEALEIVNLYEYKNRYAYTLSGGEAQRLCLARALVLEPKVLLLDEPTANLDPVNMSIIENVVRDYCIKSNSVVIFTTHNIFEAKRLADRVGLLFNGKIIEEDHVEKFFKNPKNDFTIKFIKGEITF